MLRKWVPMALVFAMAISVAVPCAASHVKHRGSSGGAGGPLAKWFRQYYAGRDRGFSDNDVAEFLARTTDDYTFDDITGAVYSRSQVINMYADLIALVLQHQCQMTCHTKLTAVTQSGDQATVDTVVRVHLIGDPQDEDGNEFHVFGSEKGLRYRDYWVHSDTGWHMNRTNCSSTEIESNLQPTE